MSKRRSHSRCRHHAAWKQFPTQLYDMLEDAESAGFGHIISWLPKGICFRVYSPHDLVEQVLPRYFGQQKRYKSFQRQLNMYEFKMLRSSPPGSGLEEYKGAFFHPLFIRGDRPSTNLILRTTTIRAHSSLENDLKGASFFGATVVDGRTEGGPRIHSNDTKCSEALRAAHDPQNHTTAKSSFGDLTSSLSLSGYDQSRRLPSDSVTRNGSSLSSRVQVPRAVVTKKPALLKSSEQDVDFPGIEHQYAILSLPIPSSTVVDENEDISSLMCLHNDSVRRYFSMCGSHKPASVPWYEHHDNHLLNYAKGISSRYDKLHSASSQGNVGGQKGGSTLGSHQSYVCNFPSGCPAVSEKEVVEEIISIFIPTTLNQSLDPATVGDTLEPLC